MTVKKLSKSIRMTRDVRWVLFKAGKAIGNGNIRAAELTA